MPVEENGLLELIENAPHSGQLGRWEDHLGVRHETLRRAQASTSHSFRPRLACQPCTVHALFQMSEAGEGEMEATNSQFKRFEDDVVDIGWQERAGWTQERAKSSLPGGRTRCSRGCENRRALSLPLAPSCAHHGGGCCLSVRTLVLR